MATKNLTLTKFSRYRYRHFDRDADFVVLRPMRVGGNDLRPGDPFDKRAVSLRTHRVLFEQRKIDEVGGCWHKISGLPNPFPPKVEFTPEPIIDRPFAPPLDHPVIEVQLGGQASEAAEVPARRKAGRPKGSKNKRADKATA